MKLKLLLLILFCVLFVGCSIFDTCRTELNKYTEEYEENKLKMNELRCFSIQQSNDNGAKCLSYSTKNKLLKQKIEGLKCSEGKS